MSRDLQLTMAKAQALTAVGTVVSTDVLDVAGIFTGRNNDPARLILKVEQSFVTSASGTVEFQLVEADNAALTTNATVLYTTGALAASALATDTKKYLRDVPLPKNSGKRYIGIKAVVATGAFTAGSYSAWIDLDSATALDDRPVYETGR